MKARPLSGGLGCNEDVFAAEPDPHWYGGSVEFPAKLVRSHSSRYRLVLERAALGTSTRVTRRFGSGALLRVRIPHDTFYGTDNGLVEYFMRPFVINGRIFRTWCIKPKAALLIATTEKWDGEKIIMHGNPGMSFLGFIRWHNPMESNSGQVCHSILSVRRC